jgi:predicted membrane protein
MLIELIGIIGSILFAICGLPLLIAAIKGERQPNSILNTAKLLLWGTVFKSIYTIVTYGFDLILISNNLITIITWTLIIIRNKVDK